MNVFYLDEDPVLAASYHCDKHVVKMIVETAQLLSTAHHVRWAIVPPTVSEHLYRQTHVNHPSAVWCRSSLGNYDWLTALGVALCDEYTNRYGKVHATDRRLRFLREHRPPISLVPFCTPPQCVPDDCKAADAVTAYRLYYNLHKSRFARWRYSPVPAWYEPPVVKLAS